MTEVLILSCMLCITLNNPHSSVWQRGAMECRLCTSDGTMMRALLYDVLVYNDAHGVDYGMTEIFIQYAPKDCLVDELGGLSTLAINSQRMICRINNERH